MKGRVNMNNENNNLIVCSSDVILSIKNFDLVESRIFYLSIYKYINEVLENPENRRNAIEMNLSEVREVLNKSYTINELTEIIKNMKKSIKLNNVNNQYVKNGTGEIYWFDYYFLDREDSKFVFKFTETFRDCIEEIFNRFTVLELDDIVKLKSKHSIRMYELYCQYANQGTFKGSLDFFYEFFCPDSFNEKIDSNGNLVKEKTLTTTDFYRSTIDKAIKEIKSKTGIVIKVEKVRKGKSLSHLILKFDNKKSLSKKEMFIVKKLKNSYKDEFLFIPNNEHHSFEQPTVKAPQPFIYKDKSYS